MDSAPEFDLIEGKEPLKREISTFGLATSIFNIVVGAGIFVLPASVAGIMGSASLAAYLFCGLVVVLIMLCYAEVGSKVTTTGGSYAYIEEAFGSLAGFTASSLSWFGFSVLSDAAIANAFCDVLKSIVPGLGQPLWRGLCIIAIFTLLVLINVRSVKSGIRLVEFTAIGKLIPLLGTVLLGFAFIHSSNLAWDHTPSFGELGKGALLLFFAFIGGESALSNSGEVINPSKNIPRAIFLGIGAVMVLYISIQLVCQGVLGDSLAQNAAPLSSLASTVIGPKGLLIMTIGTAISMFGGISGDVLSIPRVLYASGRDGLLPKFLAIVHPKFSTPHISIIIYAGLGCVFALLGGFEQLAMIASSAALLIYLGVVLATLKLRKKLGRMPGTFRVAGGPLIPILSTISIIWLLMGLSPKEIKIGAIFLVVVWVVYFVARGLKKAKN